MTLQIPFLRQEREEVPGESPPPDLTRETPAPPEPQPAGHALARPDGGRMNAAQRSWSVVRHAFRTARMVASDLSRREGGWVNAALNGRPPAVNDQRDYLNQRRWLPPGHEGGIADRAGEAYHVAYGVPGVALGGFISWLSARPFRSAWAAVAFLVTVFGLCQWPAGLTAATAGIVAGVLGAALAGWLALVTGVLALRRAGAGRRAAR